MSLFSSGVVTQRSRKLNCPLSLTSFAASRKPVMAARIKGGCETDTLDSGRGEVAYRKGLSFDSSHEVDRLGHRRTNYAHSGKVREARSEKDIGSRFFERLKAADRVVQARRGVEQIVDPSGQDKRKWQCMCRPRCCSNAFDSQAKIVERTVLVASRVLNRASDKPGLSGKPNRLSHDLRRVAESLFQIRRDGQLCCIDNQTRVRKRFISR